MFDIKQFILAIKQIAEEKGIPEESVLETVEAAIAAAYKRDYGKKGQIVRAKLDSETGDIKVTQVHYVVEGMDEEGNITGQLPSRMLEEKPDFADRLRVDQSGINSLTGGDGRIKPQEQDGQDGAIKFNPEKHIILQDAK